MQGLCGGPGCAVVMMLFAGLVAGICWRPPAARVALAGRGMLSSSGLMLLFPEVSLYRVGGVDEQGVACAACNIPPICQNLNAVGWDSSCKLRRQPGRSESMQHLYGVSRL